MRKRSMKGYMCGNLKRKATQSRNDLAYMIMWGEKPPKKHHMVTKKRTPLW